MLHPQTKTRRIKSSIKTKGITMTRDDEIDWDTEMDESRRLGRLTPVLEQSRRQHIAMHRCHCCHGMGCGVQVAPCPQCDAAGEWDRMAGWGQ